MDQPTPEGLKAAAREIRTRIDENNVLDSLVELLAAQQTRVQSLERELAIVRARMQTRDLLLPEAKLRYAGRRSVTIDAGMPIREDQGFYELEYDGKGQPYRWTGPNRTFYFDLHVDRTEPLAIKLQLGNHPIATAEGLRCFSDNVEIPLVRQVSEYVTFDAVLPPREVLGLTRLLFVARKSFAPAQHDGAWASDTRRLAVLFYRLSVLESNPVAHQNYVQLATVSESAIKPEPRPQPAPKQTVEPEPAHVRVIAAKSRKRIGR